MICANKLRSTAAIGPVISNEFDPKRSHVDESRLIVIIDGIPRGGIECISTFALATVTARGDLKPAALPTRTSTESRNSPSSKNSFPSRLQTPTSTDDASISRPVGDVTVDRRRSSPPRVQSSTSSANRLSPVCHHPPKNWRSFTLSRGITCTGLRPLVVNKLILIVTFHFKDKLQISSKT